MLVIPLNPAIMGATYIKYNYIFPQYANPSVCMSVYLFVCSFVDGISIKKRRGQIFML